MKMSTETVRSQILDQANQHGVCYRLTPDDALAEVVTRLSDDEIVTDEIEDLLVALKRAGVISGAEMVALLSEYLADSKLVSASPAR